ncbi:MAG: hypothetical protein NZ518_02205, partial [Dehalococcoidia bacterium]|nr:hypothetical protein [Dehalococcoidia bacterium]
LFFLLLTVELTLAALARDGRGARTLASFAGVAAGVGIMVKLLPALALPACALALWRAGQRTAAARLIGVSAATATAILAPFALANPTMTLASAQSLLTRSAWETPWALLDGYYSGGAVASPETRLDPTTAAQVERPSTVPMAPIVIVTGAVGLAVLWRARALATPAAVVAGVGLTVALFLLANKGYSPQFLVYVLAPLVARWPDGRGVWFAIAFSAVNLVEYPLALLLFADQPALLVVTVLLRTALLVALSVAYGADLWQARLAIGGRVAAAALAAVMLTLVGATASATATYAATRAAIDTQAEAVATLRAHRGATALFTDRYLYDRLTPFLRDAVTPRLVRADVAPRLPDGAREVWEVWAPSDEGARAAEPLARFLADRAFLIDQRVVSDLLLRRLVIADAPSRVVSGALGPFTLTRAAMPEAVPAGGLLPVALDWRSSGSLVDRKLYLHVLDDQGALVAQKDTPFASTFADGITDLVRAREAILLPAALRAGTYTVRVGVYDAVTGQRLTGPTGDGVVIGQLQVTR